MEPVQPEASVIQTGFGLRYVGTDPMFAYGYNYRIDATGGSDFTFLEFTSGSGIIDGFINAMQGDVDTDWWRIDISFNDVLTIRHLNRNGNSNYTEDMNPIPIIIPPFTKVKVELRPASDSNSLSAQPLEV